MKSESDQKNQEHCSILVIGAKGAGKSSLLQAFKTCRGEENTNEGQCLGSHTKFQTMSDMKGITFFEVSLEQYSDIYHTFDLKNLRMILIYDVSQLPSFQSIKFLLEDAANKNFQPKRIALVGNKSDIKLPARVISQEDGKGLAEKFGCAYFEISTLNKNEMDAFFDNLL